MNGRLYDPQLKRFLSPDNNIQDPFDTRSYDRYSYVWHNPLMNTDPSGEIVWFAVAIGAFFGAASAAANGGNFGDILLGALIGGIAGGLGAGVGNLAAQGLGFASALSVSGFGAGFVVGFAGGFVSGFVGATLNGLASGQNIGQAIGGGIRAGITAGVLAGLTAGIGAGVKARKAGGDFWSGNRAPVSTVNEITAKGVIPLDTPKPQGGDLSGLKPIDSSNSLISKLNPDNYQLSNSALRTEVENLYNGLVNDLGQNNFEFQVTGGDRYHLNGGNYSSTDYKLITSGKPTAHNIERGARAVDLRIKNLNGKTFDYKVIQSTLKRINSPLFYDINALPSTYGDGHHHLQLPKGY